MTFFGNIVYLRPRSVICGPSAKQGHLKQNLCTCFPLISTGKTSVVGGTWATLHVRYF